MGLPDPLNTRPSISSETGICRVLPVNLTCVCFASIPEVPSKTYWRKDEPIVGTSVAPEFGLPGPQLYCPELQALDQHERSHREESNQRFQRIWGTSIQKLLC
jgi:hypothetical protein